MANHKQILLPINKIVNVNTTINGKQIASINIDSGNDQYSYLSIDNQTNKTNVIKIKDDFDNNLKYSITKDDETGIINLKVLFYRKYRGQYQSYLIIYFQDSTIDYITPPDDLLFEFGENKVFTELSDVSYDFTTQEFKASGEFNTLFDVIGYEDNIKIYTGVETSQTRPSGINILNDGYNNTYTILKPNIYFNTFYDGMLIEFDFFELNEFDDQVFLFLKSFNDESITVRFEKHYEYKKLFFDFLYGHDFYSWYQEDVSEKISIDEELNNTFQIRIHQDKIKFYCNNKFLKSFDIDPTTFILNDLFFQIGLINQFSLKSSLYLQRFRIYSIYKYNVSYDNLFEDMFVCYNLNDDDYSIIDFSNFNEFETPSKLKLDSTSLPYYIDLPNYIGESYVDIQFKNYFLIFSKRVSILNKVLYDKQNFEDIENFIWRQLTPKFVREQQYENDSYLWQELTHVMQDFVQKLDTLGKKFGDLFHPFQTDMYLKKTLYFRFKSLNILQDYFDMVENNHQIFTLLSLEFFKEVLEYYVNRGRVDQINTIFNNQFKNLSQSLELFLFYFSQNGDIQILPYQYPTKLKDFNKFIREGGLKQIFEQQKIQLYDKHNIYFKSLEKELYKSYVHKRMMSDEFDIENTISQIVDNLLKNQAYRHIVVLFDKTSLQINDFKDSLIKFFDFIKQEYLPQNMDFVFLENTMTYTDPENQNIFDFTQLRFNYFDEPEIFFNNLKESKMVQGSLKKDRVKTNNLFITSEFILAT